MSGRRFADAAGGTRRAEIHHAPWPLEHAEAEISQEAIAPVDPVGPPVCHYAARKDVLVWRPRAIVARR